MIRPLTKAMLETLMDCHERELQGMPPCTVETTMHLKGLYQRGLVQPKLFKTETNKSVIAFYITQAGKEFLKENIF